MSGVWKIVLTLSLIAVASACFDGARAASELKLSSPEGGEVRALVIGIDEYQHVRQLKGATADARDIESSLRSMGVHDVTALINAQAERSSVLQEISAMVERTRTNDVVLLSIAGHGTQEPERIKGSQPDGMEDVFLLPGFEPTLAGSQQVDITQAGTFTVTFTTPVQITQPVVWVGFNLPVGFSFAADTSGTSVLTYWAWTSGGTLRLLLYEYVKYVAAVVRVHLEALGIDLTFEGPDQPAAISPPRRPATAQAN